MPVLPDQLLRRDPGCTIVEARSGPVEMHPICTPVRASRNARYSLAFTGNSSYKETPKVDWLEPGTHSNTGSSFF
jgi:hypothetical protein